MKDNPLSAGLIAQGTAPDPVEILHQLAQSLPARATDQPGMELMVQAVELAAAGTEFGTGPHDTKLQPVRASDNGAFPLITSMYHRKVKSLFFNQEVNPGDVPTIPVIPRTRQLRRPTTMTSFCAARRKASRMGGQRYDTFPKDLSLQAGPRPGRTLQNLALQQPRRLFGQDFSIRHIRHHAYLPPRLRIAEQRFVIVWAAARTSIFACAKGMPQRRPQNQPGPSEENHGRSASATDSHFHCAENAPVATRAPAVSRRNSHHRR